MKIPIGGILLEKSNLDKLLWDFYLISGMETSVLDADFHTVAMAKSKNVNFCSQIHRGDGAGNICKASDIEKLLQVRNSAEPLLYTCPFGITEAIVPIIRGDIIIAYIISSMGINVDSSSDEVIISEACRLSKNLSDGRLISLTKSLNHLTAEELNAYLGHLKLLSEHIGNDETLLFGSESIGRLVKRYIKNNLGSKLTLSELARNLHCSTVTLTEHFKSEFGITIMDYVVKKRMQLSEKLLISTDMPLRKIADLSGFADVEYFSRTFKKFHGISPASWRINEKNK